MRITSWLGVVVVCLCGRALAAQYSVIELPQIVTVHGLNDHGDVVGVSALSADPSVSGVYYQHSSGVVNQLSPAGEAFGINNHGQMAGFGRASTNVGPAAAVWNISGGYMPIAEPLSGAIAISNTGLVVGSNGDFHAAAHGILWNLKNSTATALGDLNSCGSCVFDAESSAAAINDKGHAVGTADWARFRTSDPEGGVDFATHAFLWKDGVIADLGTLAGPTAFSSASGINEGDEVVGSSDTRGGASHAFLFRKGRMLDLGTLTHDPTLNSAASGINDTGEIVGSSDVRVPLHNTIVAQAFVASDGRMRNLNFLLDRRGRQFDHVVLTDAVAINCHGWIAANGSDTHTREAHAYLLIPREPRHKECQHPH